MFWESHKLIIPYLMRCIQRATEVYPDAQFVAITNKPEVFPECFRFITCAEDKEELLDVYDTKDDRDRINRHYIFFSDYARMHYLANNPDTLYIDTDTYCLKRMPKLNPGVVGSRQFPCNNDVIYNNDNIHLMWELMERRHEIKDQIDRRQNLVPLIKLLAWDVNAINLTKWFGHKLNATIEPEVQAMLKGNGYGSSIYRRQRFTT